MTAKTKPEYWDSGYSTKEAIEPVDLKGWRFFINTQVKQVFDEAGLENCERIMEVGGGGSQWLARFSLDHPSIRFTCLDYARNGCRLIENFAKENKLANLDAVEADFFALPDSLEKVDLLYSLGVVEHFEDLPGVLRLHASLLKQNGKMLTVIPNMAGVLGYLTKRFNRAVYDIHVPHDLASLVAGHEDAGLEVVASGYLGTTNFGVLSSCFTEREGVSYAIYKALTRISKAIWLCERLGFSLPVSSYFSPYIYVLAYPRSS